MAIADILGHSQVSTTADWYTHSDEAQRLDAIGQCVRAGAAGCGAGRAASAALVPGCARAGDGHIDTGSASMRSAPRWAACAAKRRIIGEWEQEGGEVRQGLYLAVQILALPYADHEDYLDEWRA